MLLLFKIGKKNLRDCFLRAGQRVPVFTGKRYDRTDSTNEAAATEFSRERQKQRIKTQNLISLLKTLLKTKEKILFPHEDLYKEVVSDLYQELEQKRGTKSRLRRIGLEKELPMNRRN